MDNREIVLMGGGGGEGVHNTIVYITIFTSGVLEK